MKRTVHFSTSQSARPPFRVPRQVSFSMSQILIVRTKEYKRCRNYSVAVVWYKTTRTCQNQQIRAIVYFVEVLISNHSMQQNQAHCGPCPVCILLPDLLFHWTAVPLNSIIRIINKIFFRSDCKCSAKKMSKNYLFLCIPWIGSKENCV